MERGLGSIKSLLAQNTGLNWNKYNPINVTTGSQITSSFTTPNEVNTIARNFDIVNTIIGGGLIAEPLFTASQAAAIAVTGTPQITASLVVSGSVGNDISASIAYVATIITNGTGSLGTLVSNLNSNVKVTQTPQYITGSSYYGTNTESTQLSSSIKIITDILEGGLSVVPTLTSNVSASIKVTNASQYISASYSASASDVNFISSSISIVTKIIEGGEFSAPAFQTYTNRITSSNSVAAYEILKNNIPFIVSESIAYLSSSWAGFEYDESKCRRDLGFILSGSAEDLIWNANSASVFNGLFYWEFPSQAQGAQLQQTLDGINYASRLAQKVIQNVEFITASANILNAASLLVNNKVFIQDETIAYLSSSWGEHPYIELTCKRDVGHIIDAIRTDLVYGGNVDETKFTSKANTFVNNTWGVTTNTSRALSGLGKADITNDLDTLKVNSGGIKALTTTGQVEWCVIYEYEAQNGRYRIGKHCRVMIHSVIGGSTGSFHNLENEMEEIRYIQKTYLKALSEETGTSYNELKRMIDRKVNVYLSAEEAVKLGIADIIV